MYILKGQKIKKEHFYISLLPSTTLLFPFWRAEMSLMDISICIQVCFTFPDKRRLFFELYLHPINHETCRGSWNLVIVALGDFSTHATHVPFFVCLFFICFFGGGGGVSCSIQKQDKPFCYTKAFLSKQFIIFPAISCSLNALSICDENLWI